MDEEEAGEQEFVKIAGEVSADFMELPREKDGSVLLSTLQSQFPTAIGLKYKSSSGGWRGIRAADETYVITESDTLKRKTCEYGAVNERKSRKSSKLLEDLIVLGIPYATTQDELQTYFTDTCGELAYCELKVDRETKKSRGFGFIRFKDADAAQEAVKGHHELLGRKLEVRLSRKKDDVPMKLFVGRLNTGTTQDDVYEYFSDHGEIIDTFVPSNPFRGFGFITYSSQEDALKVLRLNHMLNGARLNVTAAEPKDDKDAGKLQNNFGAMNYHNGNANRNSPFGANQPFGQNGGANQLFGQNAGGNLPFGQNNARNGLYGQNTGYDPRSVQQQQSPQNDVASRLKDMLITLINNQK